MRGSAPGTRETDLLRTGHMIRHVHGLALSGGSAFGLETASGVMKYLEENNIGYKVAGSVVPRGFDSTTARASDVDGASVHMLKTAGIVLKRFDTSLDITCTAS